MKDTVTEQRRAILTAWLATIQGLDYNQQLQQLVDQHDAGALTPQHAAHLVPVLWHDRPDGHPVPYSTWLPLFRHANAYTVDCEIAHRPRRAKVLYRGATHNNRYGLSWTADPIQAAYFAQWRQAPGTPAVVWEAVVEPARLLAHLTGVEDEYVIDSEGLAVNLAPDWAQRASILRARGPRWKVRARRLQVAIATTRSASA